MKLPHIEIRHTAYSPEILISWTDEPWRPLESESMSLPEAEQIRRLIECVPALLQSGADQLDEWADQIERDGLVIARPAMLGIVAGMREVAADYRSVL